MLSRSHKRRSEGEREYSKLPFFSWRPGSCLNSGRAKHTLHMCCMCRKELTTHKSLDFTITASQQSMTNKATMASLSFLHPSVHQQNLSNKYANSSFLFLILSLFALATATVMGPAGKEDILNWGKRWQPANFISPTPNWWMKLAPNSCDCYCSKPRQWVKLKSHPGGGGTKTLFHTTKHGYLLAILYKVGREGQYFIIC